MLIEFSKDQGDEEAPIVSVSTGGASAAPPTRGGSESPAPYILEEAGVVEDLDDYTTDESDSEALDSEEDLEDALEATNPTSPPGGQDPPPPSPSHNEEHDLPPRRASIDLVEFCALVQRIEGEQHPYARLQAAELAAKGTYAGRQYSIVPSAAQRLTGEQLQNLRTSYDIDSLKGRIEEGDDWPFEGAIKLYTVSPWDEVVRGRSVYSIPIPGGVSGPSISAVM